MRKILIVFVLLGYLSLSAQDDKEILMRVNNKPVTVETFVKMYTKNLDLVQDETQKDIDNYLNLFINYRLELEDVYAKRYDTLPKFKREFKGYRNDLAKKYLNDDELIDKQVKELYERMKTDVKVAHILIQIPPNASPKDSLNAYNKIMKIYKEALASKDFAALVVKYSEDPSAKDNKGDLDYINVFHTVYPFESAAYNTPVGKISKPFRTRFGYHIVKVLNRRPARGNIEVAHIMTMDRKGEPKKKESDAKTRIEEIYTKLKSGKGEFGKLAKQFSDDKGSAKQGGRLREFGIRQMIPEFENQAFALKNPGDISKPFHTKYGWHIIKLLNKYPLQPFEKEKQQLRYQVTRDERSKLGREKLIRRLKKDFKIDMKGALSKVYALINKDFFKTMWKFPKSSDLLDKTLITINGEMDVKYADFFHYLSANQYKDESQYKDKEIIVKMLFEKFKDQKVLDYFNKNLEKFYPDFADIVNEYRNGLLMFYIKSDMIWNKSIKDTLGLKQFFQSNKEKFKLPKRFDVLTLQFDHKKTAKKALKCLKKNKSLDDIKKKFSGETILAKEREYNVDDAFVKTHGIDKNKYVQYKENGQYFVLKRIKIKAPESPELEKVKGKITNEYQKYLEQEWLKKLKRKYPVKLNENIWKKVRAKYKS